MKPKGVYIVTMGCQMNVYDSEQMEKLLATQNYGPIFNQDEADLIVVNTCSVRDKAEQKVYSYLGRLARTKRKKRDLIIAVGGCVAQQEGARLIERVPYVDIVFGTFAVSRLPALVEQVTRQKKQVVDVEQRGPVEPLDVGPSDFRGRRATAFVTIMRGCDNFCTYCVVPYVRGREVSRKPESILEEIRHLAVNGVREVTLLGQNVNSYGLKNNNGFDFPALLEAVNDVGKLRRLRFTTSHPKDLSDRLISAFDGLDKLVPHIHLPVQSGSDRILKRMNRGYTRDYYLAKVEKLRKIKPGIAITSDIIVGFPGEQKVDFEQTIGLVESVEFDSLYTFRYSDRRDVPAARFSDKVPEDVKHERLTELLEIQAKITLNRHRSLVGTTQDVLVEGPSKKGDGQMAGRTPCNKIVNFPGNCVRVGDLVPVRIVEAFSHSLWGNLVKCPQELSDKEGGILNAA